MHSYRWSETYFRIAKAIAGASKDPTTKVGAVIVRPDKTVASVGFNGFARGMDDSPEAYADRERKLRQVIHAELNCLLHMKEPATGCTLYVWPLPPCERCAPHIIQAGIANVVSPKIYAHERWYKSATYARAMFDEAGVTWEEYASDHV